MPFFCHLDVGNQPTFDEYRLVACIPCNAGVLFCPTWVSQTNLSVHVKQYPLSQYPCLAALTHFGQIDETYTISFNWKIENPQVVSQCLVENSFAGNAYEASHKCFFLSLIFYKHNMFIKIQVLSWCLFRRH